MLTQTKKSFANFKGTISGLHNRKKGSSKMDYDWGSKLLFFVNTSEHNSIGVGITSWNNRIGEDVYLATTDKNSARETKPIEWERRNEDFEGWELMGLQLRGKNQSRISSLVEHDAIEYILDNFEDGDNVFINCEVERSKSGDKIYTNYNIKRIYSSDAVADYNSDDFKEVSDIKDTFAFKEMVVNQEKAIVRGTVVQYGGKLVDVEYMIDTKEEIDQVIINYIKENCKFGDVLTIEGIVHNRVIGDWVETEGSKNLVGRGSSSFGGGGKRFVVKSERKEIQIIGIVDLQKQVYTEDDLTEKEFDWLS